MSRYDDNCDSSDRHARDRDGGKRRAEQDIGASSKPRRDEREGDSAHKRRRRSASSEGIDRRRNRDEPRRRGGDDRDRDRNHDRDGQGHRQRRRSRSRSRSPPRRIRGAAPLPDQSASFAINNGEAPPPLKEKPNYQPTGLLAREANTVQVSSNNNTETGRGAGQQRSRNVVLKYHEPPEARLPPPTQPWRLFRFGADKSSAPTDTIMLAERSCWLFGRETGVVDVNLDHETCGKQHAVIQFRHSVSRDEYGDKIERVRPYLIDLESKAGIKLDGKRVEPGRYVEMRNGDVVRFGKEEGEWVVMLPPDDE